MYYKVGQWKEELGGEGESYGWRHLRQEAQLSNEQWDALSRLRPHEVCLSWLPLTVEKDKPWKGCSWKGTCSPLASVCEHSEIMGLVPPCWRNLLLAKKISRFPLVLYWAAEDVAFPLLRQVVMQTQGEGWKDSWLPETGCWSRSTSHTQETSLSEVPPMGGDQLSWAGSTFKMWAASAVLGCCCFVWFIFELLLTKYSRWMWTGCWLRHSTGLFGTARDVFGDG